MFDQAARSRRLARRVRWLDRYRRFCALLTAAVAAPLVLGQLAQALGADWPTMHAAMLAIMFGAIVWVVTETVLAALTAVWETEHAALQRAAPLPQARVFRR